MGEDVGLCWSPPEVFTNTHITKKSSILPNSALTDIVVGIIKDNIFTMLYCRDSNDAGIDC